jgi:sugar lactone lactonase YvrE
MRLILFLMTFMAAIPAIAAAENAKLTEIASSESQWTGIAVSKEGRIFVNFPRWSDDVPVSVGELQKNGSIAPYPDQKMNSWSRKKDPQEHFVCVQSVVIDSRNQLWILDPAAPKMGKVVKNGPKLLRVDLDSDKIIRAYPLASVTHKKSYLNDVRITRDQKYAFITDSGKGAIVVLNLETGEAKRVLENHHSVLSEGLEVTIDGKKWERKGKKPEVHADGIALSPDERFLYYHSLTGTRLYRIPVELLTNPQATPGQLSDRVEYITDTGPADGLLTASNGTLLVTDLENKSIARVHSDKRVEPVIQDSVLEWPDSLAEGPDKTVYLTTSRIHEKKPRGAYQIFSFPLPEK